MASKLRATFIFSLYIISICSAEIGDWKTFTSAKDIRSFKITENKIWSATNGGVLEYTISDSTFNIITNTDGLASNDIVAIEVDNQGSIWIAAQNGILNVLDPQRNNLDTINDYQGLSIHEMMVYGDSMFVLLNIGVSLYDIKKHEVKETYKIGESFQAIIVDRDIWVATRDGMKQASLDFPNLIAPNAWKTFTRLNGLPATETLSVERFEGTIVAGTQSGLSFYDGVAWSPAELDTLEIRDLIVLNNQLIAITNGAVFRRIDAGVYSWVGALSGDKRISGIDGEGRLWVGLGNKGLARFDETDAAWTLVAPNGPGDNRFHALVFDHDGMLWAASSTGGVSSFDGKTWRNYSSTNGKLKSNDYRGLAVDNRNRIWAASAGQGVTIFEKRDDGEAVVVDEITSSDNRLADATGTSNYVIVSAIKQDAQGNMWVLNKFAKNRRVLAVVDTAGNWQYFTTLDGILSDEVVTLEMDNFSRIWIGTEGAGISVLDDNNTPFYKNDDDLSQGLGKEDGLENSAITSLAFDRDGVMWIGTPGRLHYWFEGQVGLRYSVINDDINVVAVDVRNNKWIGTGGGLSVLDADGFTWTHYSTSNSPLVSDNITAFAFNEITGEVYIGTSNGLSRLETPFTKPAQNLELVIGHPNPFILDGADAQFHIDNLAEKATVRIFTPEGVLVKKIPQSQIFGSRTTWYGRNDSGELVASGVYIYLVTTEDGQTKVGKVAVINP